MSCRESPLGQWIEQNGGQFHPSLEFRNDAFGLSVYAAQEFPPNSTAVTCPFSLAVTPESSRNALEPWIREFSTSATDLSDHQATCLYLLSHRLPSTQIRGSDLKHQVYIDSLPTEFETPLWWTVPERELLKGTNLYGAVTDRETSWKQEYHHLLQLLPEPKPAISWQLYLWACTVLSSRAFPSSLITGPDTPDPDPTLFPGVDTLNHQYATRVTWSSDVLSSSSLSIILTDAVPKDQQVFNSYGPKPTEELLLGYGFVLETNPSDLLILGLSKPSHRLQETDSGRPTLLSDVLDEFELGSNWRHQVPRSGILPKDLVDQVRWITAASIPGAEQGEMRLQEMREGGRSVFLGYEVEFEAINNLAVMVTQKLATVAFDANRIDRSVEIKPIRKQMADIYRQGQLEILQAVDEHLDDLMQALQDRAEKDGFDFDDLMGGEEEEEIDTIAEEEEED